MTNSFLDSYATDTDKLMKLIDDAYYHYQQGEGDSCLPINFAYYLAANGVVVRKKGEWSLEADEEEPNPMFKLVVCQVCNQTSSEKGNFCPNCGADMRKGENG